MCKALMGFDQIFYWIMSKVCPKSLDLGIQSLDFGVQSLDLGVQSLDMGIQSLDRPCTLADVIGQSLDLGVQSLDRFCTLGNVGQSVDRHWTKVGQSLDLGVQSLDLVSNQPSSTSTLFFIQVDVLNSSDQCLCKHVV